MTQSELFALVRASDQQIASLLIQIISISFAAVVATFYFLHRAGRSMRVLAFALYLMGFFSFLGLILREVSLKYMVLKALAALPESQRALPVEGYIGVAQSWLGIATDAAVNAMIWTQCVGVFWLLFFWKKPADPHPGSPPH
jgi:hypothetical protein